jgi:hypothetical protein
METGMLTVMQSMEKKIGELSKMTPQIIIRKSGFGRLPCNCEQDISNWTEKILVYEQDPGKGDASYLMNSFWIEGAETYNSLDVTKTYYPSSISHTIWYKSTLHNGSEVVAKMMIIMVF